MKFNKGQQVYYKNQGCYFVCELNPVESVVEIIIPFDGEYGVEDVSSNIIVYSRYLTEEKFDKDIEFDKAVRECEKIKREAESEANKIIYEISKEKKQLEDEFKKIKAAEVVLKYMQGKLKYAVTNQYSPEIYELSELKDESDKYKKPLRAISIIRDPEYKRRLGDFVFTIQTYADYSGGYTKCELFETLDEAKQAFIELAKEEINKTNGYVRFDDAVKKWDIQDEEILTYLKTQKENSHKKSIEDTEAELKKVSEKLLRLKTEAADE